MADNGIQRANQSQPQRQPAELLPKHVEQPVTTVTGSTSELQFFAADVPALGGVPLIVQCRDSESAQAVYRRECKGLDLNARITVRNATSDEANRAAEEKRLAVV